MFLDENIYWKDHIHNVENKIAKNIRFLFHARNLENISQKHILCIYPSQYQLC